MHFKYHIFFAWLPKRDFENKILWLDWVVKETSSDSENYKRYFKL